MNHQGTKKNDTTHALYTWHCPRKWLCHHRVTSNSITDYREKCTLHRFYKNSNHMDHSSWNRRTRNTVVGEQPTVSWIQLLHNRALSGVADKPFDDTTSVRRICLLTTKKILDKPILLMWIKIDPAMYL